MPWNYRESLGPRFDSARILVIPAIGEARPLRGRPPTAVFGL
jgi:hypothetical protein